MLQPYNHRKLCYFTINKSPLKVMEVSSKVFQNSLLCKSVRSFVQRIIRELMRYIDEQEKISKHVSEQHATWLPTAAYHICSCSCKRVSGE